MVGDHTGRVRQISETLSEIRVKAFELRDTPPEDWDFEIETRPQFFSLMEADFWEPKAVELFGPVVSAKVEETTWVSEILNSVGEPLNLDKFRDRVNRILEGKNQVSLSEIVQMYPLERGIVDVVCYRVIAGEDMRHVILNNELVNLDLNRPAQPRYVEVEELLFQRINL